MGCCSGRGDYWRGQQDPFCLAAFAKTTLLKGFINTTFQCPIKKICVSVCMKKQYWTVLQLPSSAQKYFPALWFYIQCPDPEQNGQIITWHNRKKNCRKSHGWTFSPSISLMEMNKNFYIFSLQYALYSFMFNFSFLCLRSFILKLMISVSVGQ